MKLWDVYLRAFGRPAFAPIHAALLKVALRGLGFQAWWSSRVTGEAWVLGRLAAIASQPRVLDIGANVGTYASLVLQKVPRAHVLALEPNPRSFESLAARAEALGFEALNRGAGRVAGEATLIAAPQTRLPRTLPCMHRWWDKAQTLRRRRSP